LVAACACRRLAAALRFLHGGGTGIATARGRGGQRFWLYLLALRFERVDGGHDRSAAAATHDDDANDLTPAPTT